MSLVGKRRELSEASFVKRISFRRFKFHVSSFM